YLNETNSQYNFTDRDLEELYISDTYFSKNTNITHLYINQYFEDIKINGAISSVALKDGKVFYFANRFLNFIEDRINTTSANVNAINAVSRLVSNFELGNTNDLILEEENGNVLTFSSEGLSDEPIIAELVFVKREDDLRLAWNILLFTKNNDHWWSAYIDAVTNEIIEINDKVLSCKFTHPEIHEENNNEKEFSHKLFEDSSFLVDGSSYNVFTLPSESPNHGSRQLISDAADVNSSPFGWHDVDGIAGADFTITRGNNVWAQEDRNGNGGTGYAPDGTSALNFDFPLDFDQPPAGYEDAAITNLFYTNNMMHDIWYNHGFDEVSGNFQANNYGNGGLEGDFVFADAQDGSGVNNATFGTPDDGQNPRMTMFLWNPVGPPGNPLIINTGSLAGEYSGVPATFGEPLTATPITSNLVLAVDNNNGGTSTDMYDACDDITNSSELIGNIAVLKRGDCEFGIKILRVELEGAIAAIVVNNVPDAPISMGPGQFGDNVNIPSIMVSQADGEAIIAALINGDTISASLVNNGPYQVDGDFDNGIVAHEYGHGISNRLTGGPSNTGCLFNLEQMGEGWSDWFGLMITMKASDTEANARGIATYAIGQPTTGQGIRPARYSPDFGVNAFTYGDTNNEGLSVPHGVGFVWATVLWDLTWAYIDKYGFDSDLYNGDGGNNKIMKLVIDGLKLQPCNPGFIDGRDALLAADMATTGGVDQCMIWEIFSKRGLGYGAMQGDTASRTDQVQSFTLPPENDSSLANCSSLSIDDVERSRVNIYPNPAKSKLNIETISTFGDITVSIVDLNGRTILTKTFNALGNKLILDISGLEKGLYLLEIKGETFTSSEKIIKN
ncbi:MAG: T9SS-dependent M36 family metallopeptidase, partial [Winogradskyella sp.]|nr:T9SS-dependent M36 family metallopeptidase [Winogradskyella sp.]